LGLLEKDFKEIEAFVGHQGVVSHNMALHNQSVLSKRNSLSVSLYFADNHFLDIEAFMLTQGRPMLYDDIRSSHNVAIISDDLHVKEDLDIGDSIIHEESVYRIVGISTYSDRMKNFVYLPLRYTDTLNPDSVFDHINIYWFDTKDIVAKAHEIKALLNRNHKGIENFEFTIPLEIVKKKQETQKDLDLVLFIIALMSLLTGGISIMNIMLSNISEQTREIGLKLALGATKARIIRFVLIHTMLLTFFATLIGALLGYVIVLFIAYNAKIYIIFSLKAFILAFVMAMLSGIVFGIYPAIRASNITPMSALKEY
jgi:putative ABC transport system permease protein